MSSTIVHLLYMANTNIFSRMQNDIEHLQTKLSKIEGSKELAAKLLEIVNAKTIATTTTEPEKAESGSGSGSDKSDQEKGSDAAAA